MAVFRIEVVPTEPGAVSAGAALLRDAGLTELETVAESRLFFVEGDLDRAQVERAAARLLSDPVAERAWIRAAGEPVPHPNRGAVALEVHLRPGVMDPVAESTQAELAAEGLAIRHVRTARRYVVHGATDAGRVRLAAARVLANDCIEELVVGTAGVRPAPQPPEAATDLRSIPICALNRDALTRLAREAHLFLSLAEMEAIQQHYRALGREPTDLELETLAQTWSEHCVHKTLKSAIEYHGAAMPGGAPETGPRGATGQAVTRRYDNLLRDTIARATETLIAQRRGPECLSVFVDNAGVIAFDDELGVAFKVETHNHPSAIEPYGGAATGIGGVIRDVIGCGRGARPVANTDVFCVAPGDWPLDELPRGVLHPRRVLRGVVRGVADYGNRMGIPTVNGAVVFDPRYLGNPLVFCGCIGLIPRTLITKAACPGDRVVLIGGRTGRDGIHGATFSSAELTDTHADEFSHAVQIGNAITEKRVLDAVLRARDAEGGCLFSAITDCGAGGLSSAVGEMGETVGAVVELDRVPLKYTGLRYDEIWISEAQERMVLAVPPDNLARFMEIMAAEEVEATDIGAFGYRGADGRSGPTLHVRHTGRTVGELDMEFLHRGVPRIVRQAEWQPEPDAAVAADAESPAPPAALGRLARELRRPDVASKAWIIRQYDHEVQGGSVVKPLLGPGRGPGDAAVLRPRLDSRRGIAVGCGIGPHLGDVDPYWMAACAIDEAVRNVVCVGGDPRRTAVLDNFCWGRSDDPRQLGALVRACQACHDVALAYGVPFISGKDSLNNEFALDAEDVEPLLATLERRAAGEGVDAARLRAVFPAVQRQVRATRRLAIPKTLLISALAIVPDVRRCVTPDLKTPGGGVYFVGGLTPIGCELDRAAKIHAALAEAIAGGRVAACHDVSDGGWLTALAEMSLAGRRGVGIDGAANLDVPPFAAVAAGYVVEAVDAAALEAGLAAAEVRCVRIATVRDAGELRWAEAAMAVDALAAAWSGARP